MSDTPLFPDDDDCTDEPAPGNSRTLLHDLFPPESHDPSHAVVRRVA